MGHCQKRDQKFREQPAYRNAGSCNDNRVVFNIGDNKYCLVVEMQYRQNLLDIVVGTHAQYDLINVETVNDY